MKSKLIGLFLLIWVTGFSQTVPNTTTFSLQDVIDAVSPSSNDLVECFNDANPNYFNDTYNDDSYAPANSLLRFRDYGAHNAAASAPTVTTGNAINIGVYGAEMPGNVTSDGGSTILERGIYLSTYSDMSFSTKYIVSGTTGSYSKTVSDYPCVNGTRYFRAFATNSIGTSYGSINSFNPTALSLVSINYVTTYDNINITDSATAVTAASKSYINYSSVGGSVGGYVNSLKAGSNQYTTNTGTTCKTSIGYEWTIYESHPDTVWIIHSSGGSHLSVTRYIPTVTTYTASGTWTKPSGVTHIKVEAWGGGGTGGGATGTGARAAGGTGGTYTSKVIAVPNATYAYVVGAKRTASATVVRNGNPTSFGGTLVIATGGIGGAVNATTGGATATTASTTGSVGDVIYAGGNGGAGTSASYSGGGGGGAGSTGAGGNATNQTAGTGTSQNGGNGAAGRNTAGAGAAGSTYGGGGAGGCATTTTDRAGGSGAAGLIRITY